MAGGVSFNPYQSQQPVNPFTVQFGNSAFNPNQPRQQPGQQTPTTGFKWTDPQVLSLLFGLGGTVANGVMGAKQANAQNAMTQQQLDEQRRQFDLQFGQSQAAQALAATQMNPFTQQKARQQQAILGMLVGQAAPSALSGTHFTGGVQIDPNAFKGIGSFFGPSAMAAADQAFQQTASNVSPQYSVPNYYGVGYQPGEGGLNANTPFGSRMPSAGYQAGPQSSVPASGLNANSQFAGGLPGGGNGFNTALGLAGAGLGAAQLFRGGAGAGANAAASAASHAGGASRFLSAGSPLLGASSIVSSFIPGQAGQVARGASTGAQVGSFFGPLGTGIGAGIGALGGVIAGHQNDTKGAREDFAKKLGFENLGALYEALDRMGPQGQALRNTALNVVGRHDQAGNQQWMNGVIQLFTPQQPTYSQPTLGR